MNRSIKENGKTFIVILARIFYMQWTDEFILSQSTRLSVTGILLNIQLQSSCVYIILFSDF